MPGLTSEQIHEKLTAKFTDAIGPLMPAAKDPYCTFAPARLVEICTHLKNDKQLAFDFLQDLTATDHPKENLIRLVFLHERRFLMRQPAVFMPRIWDTLAVHTLDVLRVFIDEIGCLRGFGCWTKNKPQTLEIDKAHVVPRGNGSRLSIHPNKSFWGTRSI